MRLLVICTFALAVLLIGNVFAQTTEQEMVDKYLETAVEKHTTKLGWITASFTFNRINRENDYNRFATYESNSFPGGQLEWLDNAKAFGLEFGNVFKERFAWSVGGEYWMEFGQTLDGTQTYSLSLGGTADVEEPSSKIKVWGIYTGMQYYFTNPPDKSKHLNGLALRAGGTVGYYQANWDLWDEYENLNLSTALPEGENITYKGSAPGLTMNFGADYPIQTFGMVLGLDLNYLYLNFNNIAWYNGQDEEIVATYTGNEDGRVDLGLSGFRAKVELKRFFSW